MFKIATEGDGMKIMAIAPYDGLKELMIRLGEKEDFELQVEVGDLQKGVVLAKEAVNNGTDIIISRGGTAELIQKEVPIPVVEIEVSGYDMLSVLTLVKDYPGKTAIVGFSPISEGAATISGILDIEFSTFKVRQEEEVEPILLKLKKEGYQMIIGDVITVKKAEKIGLNGILLTSGKESVIKAFQHAKRIHDLFSSLKKHYLISHSIIQEEEEGIVVYNQDFQCVFSNKYFDIEINKSFEESFNIKDAVNEVLKKGILKMIYKNGNRIWSMKGSIIQMIDSKAVVFRIQRCKSIEKQKEQGISLVSSLNDNRSVKYFNNMVSKNEEMQNTLKMAEAYRDEQAPVWISGEEGTGKESLVYFMHFTSSNRTYPLLILDCKLIGEAQWEELLNGERSNLLVQHEKGTLFFKNIDFLKSSIQGRIFDYLSKNSLGCRLIASSSKNSQTLLKSGAFNQDLYYYIARLTLHLPSLTERKEDIESLSLIFINEFNTKFGKQIVGIRNDAKDELENFNWIGNITQLKQIIEESIFVANGPYLENYDIKKVLGSKAQAVDKVQIDLSGTLEEIEQKIIRMIWIEEGKNQTRTAERLGINRTTLWRKLKSDM
ncbi:PrpR N-terminal domain-containing protein [Metabacillus sp. Hm71]|uniref:sigma-54-dependent Fis family transcriptional regulator n=1 Tax=Metabacillus sp. Hm71 TaxID=3450743 RepID=UPI003F433484